MTGDAAPSLRTGQRVKYVGLFGDKADGPAGRVNRVCKGYVKVRFDDGRIEDLHPEGLRPIGQPHPPGPQPGKPSKVG